MYIWRRAKSAPLNSSSTVVAIGNFDGVHLGHQAIIARLKEIADNKNLVPTVITFEPHPVEFLRPNAAPSRLMSWREKMYMLRQYGVKQVFSLRFDAALAQTSHDEFIQRYLIKGVNVAHVLVGADFRFGHKRRGDVLFLTNHSRVNQYTVEVLDDLCNLERRISSSMIREKLAQADFSAAAALLGRPYTMSGRVRHGDKRGRTFGFPTINLNLRRVRAPLSGIFAVVVHGIRSKPLPGAAYIGTRPAISGKKLVLEVHLLDFDQELYGVRVKVEFVHKIRDERPLNTEHDLIKQIGQDVADVRNYFVNHPVATKAS